DVEWTAWEGSRQRDWRGPGEEKEIVQIGALKLRADTLAETDALDVLVRPRINPALSDYFIRLTGITQAELDAAGVDFADGLESLKAFVGEGVRAVYSMGTDYTIIRHNCALAGLSFPFDEGLFVNLREDLARTVGDEIAGTDSSDLPAAMGFAAPGAAHQGVHDCRCIAETMRILRTQGDF
ncbi:MAG: 3'-5' exonuclease, partial [Rhodospirillales bacterium]